MLLLCWIVTQVELSSENNWIFYLASWGNEIVIVAISSCGHNSHYNPQTTTTDLTDHRLTPFPPAHLPVIIAIV